LCLTGRQGRAPAARHSPPSRAGRAYVPLAGLGLCVCILPPLVSPAVLLVAQNVRPAAGHYRGLTF